MRAYESTALSKAMTENDSALVQCASGHQWRAELLLDDGGWFFRWEEDTHCETCGGMALEAERREGEF